MVQECLPQETKFAFYEGTHQLAGEYKIIKLYKPREGAFQSAYKVFDCVERVIDKANHAPSTPLSVMQSSLFRKLRPPPLKPVVTFGIINLLITNAARIEMGHVGIMLRYRGETRGYGYMNLHGGLCASRSTILPARAKTDSPSMREG